MQGAKTRTERRNRQIQKLQQPSTSLLVTDRTRRQKTSKYCSNLLYLINQRNDIYRTLHLTATELVCFSSQNKPSTKTIYLGHKRNQISFKQIQIMESMFSDEETKLDINHRKNVQKNHRNT